jgi:triacylglycerol lipase
VHLGFYHTFSSMCTELGRFVSQQISSGAKPVDTIHCIGHSLGGAIATLTADWAKRTTKKHVVLYTFGAPKTGFEGFCFALTKMLGINNIHRMYHATDPVPMVPLYPFTHPPLPGYGHFKGSNEALLSVSAHFMGKYIESAEGATWDSMAGPPPQITFEQSVENFLMSHENVNPLSAASWVWINAAMEYVLKKIMGAAGVAVQFPFTNAVTLADKIALILLKGIELKIGADQWVLQLMRKMMQLLHMKVVETIRELTRALMRNILELIMARITAEAKKAIEQITKR